MGTARDKEDTHSHIFSRSKSPSTTESGPPVREVGKPSKWSVKLPRNRLRGHVLHKDLANNVMDQKRTSGQLPEATSTGRALYVNLAVPSADAGRLCLSNVAVH